MNYRMKIQVIMYAEPSKLNGADEQIHVYLLSQFVDHLKHFFYTNMLTQTSYIHVT